jgi:hypothetical protein
MTSDSKFLHFSVKIVPDPGTPAKASPVVLLEHVHADVGLSSTKQGFNGMPQDTIDDHLHTGSLTGVLITDKYSYDDDFAIEGYSQMITSGWGYMAGGYGAFDLDDERLTESNLRHEGGVTGNKFMFVYKILIQDAGSQNQHEVEFFDEFLVPVG